MSDPSISDKLISDMDAPMRSLGDHTVPDGAVGIYQHLLFVCLFTLSSSTLRGLVKNLNGNENKDMNININIGYSLVIF